MSSTELDVQFLVCPYNYSHFVSKKNFDRHVAKCAARSSVDLNQFPRPTVEMRSFQTTDGVFVFGLNVNEPRELSEVKRAKQRPAVVQVRVQSRYWRRQNDQRRRRERRNEAINDHRNLMVKEEQGDVKMEPISQTNRVKREGSVESHYSSSTNSSDGRPWGHRNFESTKYGRRYWNL